MALHHFACGLGRFGAFAAALALGACSLIDKDEAETVDVGPHAVIMLAGAEGPMGAVRGSTSVALDLINGEVPGNSSGFGFFKSKPYTVPAGPAEILVTAAGDETYGSCVITFTAAAGETYQVAHQPDEYSADAAFYTLQLLKGDGEEVSGCKAEKRDRKLTPVPPGM